MKTSDLEPGMEVAVKTGPGSKTCFRAYIVSLDYWHWRDSQFRQTDSTADGAGIGIAVRENSHVSNFTEAVKTLAQKLGGEPGLATRTARLMLKGWGPTTTRPSLIVEPWSVYQIKSEEAQTEKNREVRLKEEEEEKAYARQKTLGDRLGLVLSRKDNQTVYIKMDDLEKIVDHMDMLSARLDERTT